MQSNVRTIQATDHWIHESIEDKMIGESRKQVQTTIEALKRRKLEIAEKLKAELNKPNVDMAKVSRLRKIESDVNYTLTTHFKRCQVQADKHFGNCR